MLLNRKGDELLQNSSQPCVNTNHGKLPLEVDERVQSISGKKKGSHLYQYFVAEMRGENIEFFKSSGFTCTLGLLNFFLTKVFEGIKAKKGSILKPASYWKFQGPTHQPYQIP